MKDIGIIYDGGTGHTKEVAEKIRDRFGEETAECRPIGEVSADEIGRYRHLVLGAPTGRYRKLLTARPKYDTPSRSRRPGRFPSL